MTALVLVTVAGLLLVSVVHASHRARAAADLAALGAAGSLVAGESAVDVCRRARHLAAANSAVLVTCRIESGMRVRVVVDAVVNGATGWRASAEALAGPP